jgi:diaminopimelate epimerase
LTPYLANDKLVTNKEIAMTITVEQVIEKYIETRDAFEAEKKLFDSKVADLKALQESREKWLMGALDKMGATSMKAPHGTVFIDWKDSATVADAGTFLAWVHEDWDERNTFLENRVSKTAVKQRLEDGQTPPPGVSYVKVKDVKIRRS